jgi:hypothetical protein
MDINNIHTCDCGMKHLLYHMLAITLSSSVQLWSSCFPAPLCPPEDLQFVVDLGYQYTFLHSLSLATVYQIFIPILSQFSST